MGRDRIAEESKKQLKQMGREAMNDVNKLAKFIEDNADQKAKNMYYQADFDLHHRQQDMYKPDPYTDVRNSFDDTKRVSSDAEKSSMTSEGSHSGTIDNASAYRQTHIDVTKASTQNSLSSDTIRPQSNGSSPINIGQGSVQTLGTKAPISAADVSGIARDLKSISNDLNSTDVSGRNNKYNFSGGSKQDAATFAGKVSVGTVHTVERQIENQTEEKKTVQEVQTYYDIFGGEAVTNLGNKSAASNILYNNKLDDSKMISFGDGVQGMTHGEFKKTLHEITGISLTGNTAIDVTQQKQMLKIFLSKNRVNVDKLSHFEINSTFKTGILESEYFIGPNKMSWVFPKRSTPHDIDLRLSDKNTRKVAAALYAYGQLDKAGKGIREKDAAGFVKGGFRGARRSLTVKTIGQSDEYQTTNKAVRIAKTTKSLMKVTGAAGRALPTGAVAIGTATLNAPLRLTSKITDGKYGLKTREEITKNAKKITGYTSKGIKGNLRIAFKKSRLGQKLHAAIHENKVAVFKHNVFTKVKGSTAGRAANNFGKGFHKAFRFMKFGAVAAFLLIMVTTASTVAMSTAGALYPSFLEDTMSILFPDRTDWFDKNPGQVAIDTTYEKQLSYESGLLNGDNEGASVVLPERWHVSLTDERGTVERLRQNGIYDTPIYNLQYYFGPASCEYRDQIIKYTKHTGMREVMEEDEDGKMVPATDDEGNVIMEEYEYITTAPQDSVIYGSAGINCGAGTIVNRDDEPFNDPIVDNPDRVKVPYELYLEESYGDEKKYTNTQLELMYHYAGNEFSYTTSTNQLSKYYQRKDGEVREYGLSELYRGITCLTLGLVENKKEGWQFYSRYMEHLLDEILNSGNMRFSIECDVAKPDAERTVNWVYVDPNDPDHTEQMCSATGYKRAVKINIFINDSGIIDMMNLLDGGGNGNEGVINAEREFLITGYDPDAELKDQVASKYWFEKEQNGKPYSGWRFDQTIYDEDTHVVKRATKLNRNIEYAMLFYDLTFEEWNEFFHNYTLPGTSGSPLTTTQINNMMLEIEQDYANTHNGESIEPRRLRLIRTALSEVGWHEYYLGGGHQGQYNPELDNYVHLLDCSGWMSICLYKGGAVKYEIRSASGIYSAFRRYNWGHLDPNLPSEASTDYRQLPPATILTYNQTGSNDGRGNHVMLYCGYATPPGESVPRAILVECTRAYVHSTWGGENTEYNDGLNRHTIDSTRRLLSGTIIAPMPGAAFNCTSVNEKAYVDGPCAMNPFDPIDPRDLLPESEPDQVPST